MVTRMRAPRMRSLVALTVLLLVGCQGAAPATTVAAPMTTTSVPTVTTIEDTTTTTVETTSTTLPAVTTTPVADDEELRAAVVAYSDAFLSGDSDGAYGILSERCQDRHTQDAFAVVVEAAAAFYGAPLPLQSFEAEVAGDLARVSYTYAVPALDQLSEPWVREGGEWKQDDC